MNANPRYTAAHGMLLASTVLVRTPVGVPRGPEMMVEAA